MNKSTEDLKTLPSALRKGNGEHCVKTRLPKFCLGVDSIAQSLQIKENYFLRQNFDMI